MCGRYWIEPDDDEQLMRLLLEMQCFDAPAKTSGEIFPGDHVPVVCKSRAGNTRCFAMEWGWKLADGKRIINARSETAAQKPLFRDGMQQRRCLLPMSAYFEWEKGENQKIRHRIHPQQGGLHYLAGLYRFEQQRPVCTVLTTAAIDEIAFIHHRMPVILSVGEQEAWLNGENWDFMNRPAVIYDQA